MNYDKENTEEIKLQKLYNSLDDNDKLIFHKIGGMDLEQLQQYKEARDMQLIYNLLPIDAHQKTNYAGGIEMVIGLMQVPFEKSNIDKTQKFEILNYCVRNNRKRINDIKRTKLNSLVNRLVSNGELPPHWRQ